jgi:hypothetical protein
MKRGTFGIIAILFSLTFLSLAQTSAQTSGLIAHYTFDDGTAADSAGSSSGNITEATATGGKYGQALQFDGINDSISLSNPSTFNFNNNYSISFWVKPNSNFSGTIFRLSNSSSNTISRDKYEIRIAKSGVTFITGDGATADSDIFITSIEGDAWTHITCVHGSDDSKSCYKNGTLISSARNDVNTSLVTPIVALIGTNKQLEGNNFYEGALDEVRIYNRALPLNEIQSLSGGTISEPVTPPPTEPVTPPPTTEPPPAPSAGTCTQVSQFGITWIFDKAYTCGTFANGDYWVKAPVTITRITPDFSNGNNGWEVNPKVRSAQGFQSNKGNYDPSLMPALPYTASTDQSIVKVIGGTKSGNISGVKMAAVLTVLMNVPENNGASHFRPPYVGDAKPLYKVSDLRTDLLPSYAPVGTPPSLDGIVQTFSKGLRMDHNASAPRWFRPFDVMGDYQPENTAAVNEAALRLMLNDPLPAKMPALIQFTQHTIDQAYAVLGGYRKQDDGHNPNHRILAGWAAALLDIQPVKDVLMNEATIMQEDAYVYKSKEVALWGEQSSEQGYWNYVMTDSGSRSQKDPYGYIDGGRLSSTGASYQNITAQSHKGQVLATILMPALRVSWRTSHWPVLQEYVDRWVTLGVWAKPDPCAPYDGVQANYGKTFGPDVNNPGKCIQGGGRSSQFHGANKDGGQYKSAFVAAMWNAYRGQVSIQQVSTVSGDFNKDGVVNSLDLSLMSGAWNTNNGTYDLNKDSTVNTLDYSILVQNWTR